jgi:hypothetical protein
MNGTTYIDRTKKVGITLPDLLIKQTDKLRGDVPHFDMRKQVFPNFNRVTYIFHATMTLCLWTYGEGPSIMNQHYEDRAASRKWPIYSLEPI